MYTILCHYRNVGRGVDAPRNINQYIISGGPAGPVSILLHVF